MATGAPIGVRNRHGWIGCGLGGWCERLPGRSVSRQTSTACAVRRLADGGLVSAMQHGAGTGTFDIGTDRIAIADHVAVNASASPTRARVARRDRVQPSVAIES